MVMRLLYFLKQLTATAGDCVTITCGVITYIYHINNNSLDCSDIVEFESELYLLMCDIIKYERTKTTLGFIQHDITVERKY